ncbi:MAG: amino acid adenylation domain-containing protein, partial [Telmatospirillum sp.]|nr:amino acid adenylation domain-containing protein [Telmatospirillum sp.]
MSDKKRAILVDMMRRASAEGRYAADAIAIIGVAGRYPGAGTPEALWELVEAGRSAIREVPSDRWDASLHFDADGRDGKSYSKWAGFLDGVDRFDPLFFQISPLEAEAMDPQERLFLETAWATLEDAGYTRQRLAGNNPVGVFVGVMNADYQWMAGEADAQGVRTEAGTAPWSMANRISHIFDFRGPSLAVDTACSASLTAIHLACQSLRLKECNVALAGGVNLILHPSHLRALAARGMISRGDRCRSFGDGADGFVDGEGVGAGLLKPLLPAILDDDRILGVIRGSAINSGGRSSGYTVPRASAQAEVIRAALRKAGIDPRTISYVEAHGTGTALGDPVEIAGLVEAFRDPVDLAIAGRDGAFEGSVALGSIKSNIGHLESAAGIAGLTKLLMQFRHGRIAPSLNAGVLNPEIDLRGSPFAIASSGPWIRPRVRRADGEVQEMPRRAGLSSFGGGGANAHLIVEEFAGLPVPPADAGRPGPDLIVLSARTEDRLRETARRLADFLDAPAGMGAATGDGDGGDSPLLEDIRACAADLAGVDPDSLDPDADLADYGFGLPGFARLAAALRLTDGDGTGGNAAGADLLMRLGSVRAIARHRAGSGRGGPSLSDVAHTLQVGREPMEWRLAFPAPDIETVIAIARRLAVGDRPDTVAMGRSQPAARQSIAREEVEDAIRRRDLPRLADLWTRGAEIDWDRIPNPAPRRRVALPTYPFAGNRYWIATPARAPAVREEGDAFRETAPATMRETPARGEGVACYRPVRVPAGPLGAFPRAVPETGGPASPDRPERVVILSTRASAPLADDIAARHDADEVLRIALDSPGATARIQALEPFDRAYHLGAVRAAGDGVTLRTGAGGDEPGPDDALDSGILSLFDLARRLSEGSLADRPVCLHILSTDTVAVAGEAVKNPLGAGVHALGRVIAKERPRIIVQSLDVAASDLVSDGRRALVDIATGRGWDPSGATLVVRGGRPSLFRLGPTRVAEPGHPVFRDQGVYVIVGGTGGIGRLVSHWLARTVRARLVWASRGAPDDGRQPSLDAIRAAGGEILHVRADCASLADLRRVEAAAVAAFGRIDGVIHSAMTFDNRRLTALSRAEFRSALAAKVDGSMMLDQVFGDRALDFMLFFSSVGAFGGAAGNGAYTSASAMQDAIGQSLAEARPYPVRVINWGYWGAIGSGARSGLSQTFEALGIGVLDPDEALRLVARVIAGPARQVMAVNADPAALAPFGVDRSLPEDAPEAAASVPMAPAAPSSDRPLLAGVAPVLAGVAAIPPAVGMVVAAHRALGEQSCIGLLAAFRRLGAFLDAGMIEDKAALAARLAIVPKYHRLFEAALRILTSAGYLRDLGDRVEVTPQAGAAGDAADRGDWIGACDDIVRGQPDAAAVAGMAKRVLAAYPDLLRGTVNATEIMFPGGSTALIEGLYRDNALSDHFNRVLARGLGHFAAHRLATMAPGERLRVIEFGAGTGATTKWVLDELRDLAPRLSYVYTDVSPLFLERGAREFGTGRDFMEFRLLDLEREASGQGFEPGSFDAVVASNVIHATRSLRSTLGIAGQLLKAGGWLLMNELTEPTPLVTLTGGPLEGWWRFSDAELRRPDSPLCSVATWRRLLAEEGFGQTLVPGDGPDCGQHVILAERGGGPTALPFTADATPVPHDAPARVPHLSGGGPAVPLETIVAGALKLTEAMDPDRPLSDYGLDSLVGLKVAAAILDALGVKLPLAAFYQYPTLRELSRYLETIGGGANPPALPANKSIPALPANKSIPALPANKSIPALPENASVPVLRSAPLPAVRPAPDHPLSIGQRALWDIARTAEGGLAYNVPFALWLDPGVDVDALRGALQTLADRHGELRGHVVQAGGEPVFRIPPHLELPLDLRDLSRVPEAQATGEIRAEAGRPFDLAAGPLVRATLYTLAGRRPVLLLTFHHIVVDGLSAGLLIGDLERAYRALRAGRTPDDARPGEEYGDFTGWQRQMLAGGEGERQRRYWLGRLGGTVMPQALPYDRPRPARPRGRGASLEGRFNRDLTARARSFASVSRGSLSSVVLAAYLAVLHRFTLSDHATIGIATTGRPGGRFADVVGYFANIAILSLEIRPEEGLRGLTGRVHAAVMEAVENGDIPLSEVVSALAADGRPPAPGFLRAAFYFQGWVRPLEGEGLVRGGYPGVHQEGEFDLTLDVIDEGADCGFTLKYDPDLFDRATILRIRDYLAQILEAGLAAPDCALGALALVRPAEEPATLLETAIELEADRRLVPELVARQAARRPDAVAVRSGDVALTYRELARRVDALAACLARRGARPGRTVGVFVDRSADMLVALLAVMASGAAYVPLDPVYPPARLGHIVSDAAPHLIITTGAAEPLLGDAPAPRLRRDLDRRDIAGDGTVAGGIAGPAASDAAYVIYTSGSTGVPKGVEVTHGALVNILRSLAIEPGLSDADRMFAVTTVCFDIAAVELYLPLILGASVEIATGDDLKDGRRLRAALERSGATVTQATPSAWKMLIAAGWQGDRRLSAWCGGEAIDGRTADALFARCRAVWNLYGPTETTIWSTVSRLLPGETPTIGRAAANTTLAILDADRHPVAPGLPGELFIGGAGVARGYFNRPDLTADRFPVLTSGNGGAARFFRTGDLVRCLGDGRIEFIGRVDHQVKIRGYRVEPGEIETAMRRLPGVRDAVVVAARVGSQDGLALRAFYVADQEVDCGPLRDTLPDYMVPAIVVRLDALPRLPNGKIDRGALSGPDLDGIRSAGAGAVSATDAIRPAVPALPAVDPERIAAQVVELVAAAAGLVADGISPQSRFGELGLGSIGLTDLGHRLGERFGLDLAPTVFYAHPSVAALASHLVRLLGGRADPVATGGPGQTEPAGRGGSAGRA